MGPFLATLVLAIFRPFEAHRQINLRRQEERGKPCRS